jgi:ribosome maturation factor RimP
LPYLKNIEHYQRFLGQDVKLRLLRSVNGRRKFNGAIGSVSEANNSKNQELPTLQF